MPTEKRSLELDREAIPSCSPWISNFPTACGGINPDHVRHMSPRVKIYSNSHNISQPRASLTKGAMNAGGYTAPPKATPNLYTTRFIQSKTYFSFFINIAHATKRGDLWSLLFTPCDIVSTTSNPKYIDKHDFYHIDLCFESSTDFDYNYEDD